MKNKQENINHQAEKGQEEILDLQVFLTRPPGVQPLEFEGLPSFIISGEERRGFSQASEFDLGKEQEAKIQQTYIAVANSSVVEVIKFPFDAETIIDMMRGLDFNQVRLLECMRFGTQLFNFAIHGSIRDLFRDLSNKSKTLRLTIALSNDGYTIAIGAPIKPKDTTEVQGIPGTGSRHLSAQRITKETDSIAFVVSKDGPITIFYEGKVEFRTP